MPRDLERSTLPGSDHQPQILMVQLARGGHGACRVAADNAEAPRRDDRGASELLACPKRDEGDEVSDTNRRSA